MNLVVSIGNTTVRFAAMEGLKCRVLQAYSHTNLYNEDEVQTLVYKFGREFQKTCAIASVVPSLHARVDEIVTKYFNLKVKYLSSADIHLMKIFYYPQDSLGPDRLAGVLGLRAEYGYPSISVDCGTATTINVLDRNGDFVGGTIAPGVGMSFQALSSRTALLPQVSSNKVAGFIGQSTEQAIVCGVYWQSWFGLIETIKNISAIFGKLENVVFTGGNALNFSKLIREAGFKIDEQLVLKGLSRFLHYHDECY